MNTTVASTLAASLKSNAATLDLLKVHSNLQNLKNLETPGGALDLSSKTNDENDKRFSLATEESDPNAIAKVEEIESDCDRDTRVSV